MAPPGKQEEEATKSAEGAEAPDATMEEASAEAPEAAMEEAKEEPQEEVKEEPKEEAKEEPKEEEEAKEESKEDVEMKAEGSDPVQEAGLLKPKVPAKPVEVEQDAPDDPRPRVPPGSAVFTDAGASMNALVAHGGRVLTSLTDGGFQHLLAGARASMGVKSGRYMFEVKLLELMDGQGQTSRSSIPQNYARVGFALAGGGLPMVDSADFAAFDVEGFLWLGKVKKKVAQKFSREQTVAVLLNLDAGSPSANTISMFRNGERVSEPQALPESLLGKALFPAILYKNVSLQVNMGPSPMTPLPFKCSMLADAATEDCEVTPPKDGSEKLEVVLPVGLPDTGYFDWVDAFVAKNPDYEELSDRRVIEWATKSGLWRPGSSSGGSQTGSADKPEVKFGVPGLDDNSVRRMLVHLAQSAQRSYMLPELAGNLTQGGRKQQLAKFRGANFTRTAIVLMGEPSEEHKEKIQSLILADKQAKANASFKAKKAEATRKKLLEAKRKKAEDAKKAREAAARKKAGKEPEEEDEPAEEEPPAAEEDPAEEPPTVELTEDEKKVFTRKGALPDLSEKVLKNNYASFSLPTAEEGFDQIKYVWQQENDCATVLKDWIFAKKMVQRVDSLQPGQGFQDAWKAWQKQLGAYKNKQNEWKDPAKRKKALEKRKEEAKKKAEEDGTEPPAEAAEPEAEVDLEDIDAFTVEDVTDIGGGRPLFCEFAFEDWTMLSTRFELHLLVHSFKKDLQDPDRPSFGEAHLAFYYQKYFRKPFNVKAFSFDSLPKFVETLLQGTMTINATNGFLEPLLPEDAPASDFVKQVEDNRRERRRRTDAGDETAVLKIVRNLLESPSGPGSRPQAVSPGPQKPGSVKPTGRSSHGPQQPSSAPPRMQMVKAMLASRPGMQKTMVAARPGPQPPSRPPAIRPVMMNRPMSAGMGPRPPLAHPWGGPGPMGSMKRPFPAGPRPPAFAPNKSARPGSWKGR